MCPSLHNHALDFPLLSANELQVLVSNHARSNLAIAWSSQSLNNSIPTLNHIRVARKHGLHARHEVLSIKLAVAASRGVIDRLQGIDLIGSQTLVGSKLFVRRYSLRNAALQELQLALRALEMDSGVRNNLSRILEIHLRRHAATVQLDGAIREVLHLSWDEEAAHEQAASRDTGEDDGRVVERYKLRHRVLDEVVDCLGMGNTVGALETLASAPEEVWVGSEEGDAHGVGLDGLVGEVEEGLAAIAMEQDVCT